MIPVSKNIALLHPYMDTLGGAMKMMVFLGNTLSLKNTVIFYTLKQKKEIFSKKDLSFFIKSYSSGIFGKFFSFIQIAFEIREKDYIIVGNSPMHFVAVFSQIFFRSKAKIIWWNHHYPWYYNGNTNVYIWLKRYIERIFVKRIDIVLASSSSLKQYIDILWNIQSEVLYPVLDDEFLKPRTMRETITKTIFSYGRWVEGKNLSFLFEVYENLQKKIPDLTLFIGGDGKEIEKFRTQYKNNRNVKFLGSLNTLQIINTLQDSNVFLFPSYIDSFGLVQIEAMSQGVPVICFKTSSHSEVIQNNINGFEVESLEDFIEKAYDILLNSSLRKKLSKGALKTTTHFTSHSFIKRLENIFGF